MEVVKEWPGVGIMAEEVEEDVSLQRKRFRQNSNTMKTYEDGLPVQPLRPAQSFDDAEDSESSCESSRSESPNFLISDVVLDKTLKIESSDIRNTAVKHFDEKILPLPLIEQHVPKDSFSMSESPNFLISDVVLDKTLKIEIESSDIRNGAVKHFDEKILSLPLIEQHVPKDSFSSGSGKQVSFSSGIIENGKVEVREEIEKEVGELDLESVYEKPGSHNFYCPNCNSCITKVIIRERELDIRKRELDIQEKELESRLAAERRFVGPFRCTSCFSFLIPIGNWFFPKRVSPAEEDPAEQDAGYYTENTGFGQSTPQIDHQDSLISKDPVSSQLAEGNTVVINKLPKSDMPEILTLLLGPPLVDGGRAQDGRLDAKKETAITIVEDFRVGTVVQSQESMEIHYDQEIQSDSNVKDPSSDQKDGVDIIVSKNPTEIQILTPALAPLEVIIDEGKKSDDPMNGIEEIPAPKGPVSITVIGDMTETAALEPSRESKRWQILKSIVYGGLAESITSLGIVTSAASADTKTANIVVLALANLIGGLFVIGHNLRDLKNDKFQRSKGETEEQVDRYGEAFGEREHIVLHFTIVILSFIVFGLIPPLVYGLSFRVSDDRYFKLAAVAATSLVCISLLALGKAHIQRPSKWQKYITVLFYYLGIGIGVSGLSYLAGYFIGKLLDKFGWFKASSGAALLLPGTGFSEPGFGSY